MRVSMLARSVAHSTRPSVRVVRGPQQVAWTRALVVRRAAAQDDSEPEKEETTVPPVTPSTTDSTPAVSDPEPAIPEPVAAVSGFTAASAEPEYQGTDPLPGADGFEVSAADIKAALLDSLYGTERGLTARSELRAEISELISQLESKTPVPNPSETLEKLDGSWKLLYTNNSVLKAALALGRLPLVSVGDVVQKIDAASMTVENIVALSGPLSRTSITATASFEVRSPKRLQLKLQSGTVATPTLTGDLDIPSSVSVLGTPLDLSPIKSALEPLKSSTEGVVAQLQQLVQQVPDLNIPLASEDATTWQLNTYVDEDLRIARGDGGSVFIYTREGPAPYYPTSL